MDNDNQSYVMVITLTSTKLGVEDVGKHCPVEYVMRSLKNNWANDAITKYVKNMYSGHTDFIPDNIVLNVDDVITIPQDMLLAEDGTRLYRREILDAIRVLLDGRKYINDLSRYKRLSMTAIIAISVALSDRYMKRKVKSDMHRRVRYKAVKYIDTFDKYLGANPGNLSSEILDIIADTEKCLGTNLSGAKGKQYDDILNLRKLYHELMDIIKNNIECLPRYYDIVMRIGEIEVHGSPIKARYGRLPDYELLKELDK